MSLFETQGGELLLGLLDVAPGVAMIPSLDRLELAIELRARTGMPSAGGSIQVTSGEFSARDGVALDITLPVRSVTLPAGIALSAARPNPFSVGTQMAVRLDRAADARVTVHDLSGRRVATLWSGRLEAGSRDLAWNGTDDRGDRVRDGVYFVRLAAGGRVASQKVVLLQPR